MRLLSVVAQSLHKPVIKSSKSTKTTMTLILNPANAGACVDESGW